MLAGIAEKNGTVGTQEDSVQTLSSRPWRGPSSAAEPGRFEGSEHGGHGTRWEVSGVFLSLSERLAGK